jgi:low affinity Fe/Cu permease
MKQMFRSFASATSEAAGSPWAFIVAVLVIVVWGITGPIFGFSDTWQLVINTGTTIVTFLMVFLIQNTQNRDAKAMHLKLDELIRALHGARTHLVDLEDLTDEELEDLQKQFQLIRERVASGVPEQNALAEAQVATEQAVEAQARAQAAAEKAEAVSEKAEVVGEKAEVAHELADAAHERVSDHEGGRTNNRPAA